MDDLLNLFKIGGSSAIIGVVIAVIVLGLVFWWGLSRRKNKRISDDNIITERMEKDTNALKTKAAKLQGVKQYNLIGTGNYKAIVFRRNGAIDFTTIPEPVGELHQADTSCPVSGSIFTVLEGPDGELIDYDTREVPIITEELPEWAYFAINCREIVRRFWQIPFPFWRSVSIWFAAGMILIVFICFLAVFGG